MSEVKDDLKREKVRIVEISKIQDFPDHPFLVKEDESMDQLVNSIRMNGVLNPVIARRVADEHYELISGHRRKRACILLGIDRIPLIGREMTREEAVIEMVDSNLQREHILPSEKAKAYKMKYEALKRKAGRPSKDNLSPMATNLRGQRTDELVGEENGDSKDQVRRYIRLNELTLELLEFVDEGKIGMRPAVELSRCSHKLGSLKRSASHRFKPCPGSHNGATILHPNTKVLVNQGLFVFLGVKNNPLSSLHLFPDLLDSNLRLYRIIKVNCFFYHIGGK